jgi:hypothetical protein
VATLTFVCAGPLLLLQLRAAAITTKTITPDRLQARALVQFNLVRFLSILLLATVDAFRRAKVKVSAKRLPS